MRIIHLSDIHFWHLGFRPRDLFSKRLVGLASLYLGRARKFRLERASAVIERVQSLQPDHVLITGDLTTTAAEREFADAAKRLAPLLESSDKVTIIPGNHDRYTNESVAARRYENHFGSFAPSESFPWLRPLDEQTAILGLDPCRPDLTAFGVLPDEQLDAARTLLESGRPRRLIVACHYPASAPPLYQLELHHKRMINAGEVQRWLAKIGPHLYCCGHVHAAWAHEPHEAPGQLCLNAGAPLLRDPLGHRPPGFLEIVLDGDGVAVAHHGWNGRAWGLRRLHQDAEFFKAESVASL